MEYIIKQHYVFTPFVKLCTLMCFLTCFGVCTCIAVYYIIKTYIYTLKMYTPKSQFLYRNTHILKMLYLPIAAA